LSIACCLCGTGVGPGGVVPLKVASDLLGHSSISVTADIYIHTSDDTARDAIDTLGGRLGP
jgi:integrase